MPDKVWDVFLVVLSAVLGTAFSRTPAPKKKTPKQPPKHAKRSQESRWPACGRVTAHPE